MSIDMYVSASKTQATSVESMTKTQIQGYDQLQKAISDFTLNSPFLSGAAYDSAKAYYSQVLYPLAQGGILLSEAVEQAVNKFPEEYQSQVDSGDLKQSELEEKIRQVNQLMAQVEEIDQLFNSSTMPEGLKFLQKVASSKLMSIYGGTKQKLEKQLEKLLLFNSRSASIFSDIESLEVAVTQGLAQTTTAFNVSTGTFTLPSKENLAWSKTITDKWGEREEEIEKTKFERLLSDYEIFYSNARGREEWSIRTKSGQFIIAKDNPELYRILDKYKDQLYIGDYGDGTPLGGAAVIPIIKAPAFIVEGLTLLKGFGLLTQIGNIPSYVEANRSEYDDLDEVTSNEGNTYNNKKSENHKRSTTRENPITGDPDSSVDLYDKHGNLARRRWFGPDGKAIRDVDYSNHGNSIEHPEVPHEHDVSFDGNGKLIRVP